MTVTPTVALVVDELLRGQTVAETATLTGTDADHAGVIARRLLDTGLAAPRPAFHLAGDVLAADVAAVIPARNAAATIGATIASLVGVREIVVVDDGSTDATAEIARSEGARVVRHEHSVGPAGARNRGVGQVNAEIVVLLDSDAAAEPGWLDPLLAHLADPGVGGVAPRVITRGDDSLLGRFEAAGAGVLDRGTEAGVVRPDGAVTFVSTTALVIRREVWRELGGFDESLRFGEDLDLVWKAAALGRPIVYEPASVVHHRHRPSLRSHLVNRSRYGTASGPLSRRHPGYPRAGTAPPLLTAAGIAALMGWLRASAVLAAISVATLSQRLRAVGDESGEALRGSAVATVRAGRALAGAVSTPWLPLAVGLAVLRPRSRWAVLGAIGARHALAWPQRRRGTEGDSVGLGAWLLLRVSEDMALSLGVIRSCVDARTIEPMTPGRPPGPNVTTTVLGRELVLP